MQTTPSGANLLLDAGQLEVVDFVVTDPAHEPSTEFDLIVSDLKPLLGSGTLADLANDTTGTAVAVLAIQSGYPPGQVAAAALASKLQDYNTPAPLIYALLRQGHLANPQAMRGTEVGLLQTSVAAAITAGTVRRRSTASRSATTFPPSGRK